MPARPNDIPPNGPAPGEMPPGEELSGSMPPGGSSSASPYTFSGSYALDGKTGKETNANYTVDTSAVYVLNCSRLTLINPTISVKDAVISCIGAEGAVIEGKNTIALTNTTLKSNARKS